MLQVHGYKKGFQRALKRNDHVLHILDSIPG